MLFMTIHEVSNIVKFIESESGMVSSGAMREGGGGLLINRCDISVRQDLKVCYARLYLYYIVQLETCWEGRSCVKFSSHNKLKFKHTRSWDTDLRMFGSNRACEWVIGWWTYNQIVLSNKSMVSKWDILKDTWSLATWWHGWESSTVRNNNK